MDLTEKQKNAKRRELSADIRSNHRISSTYAGWTQRSSTAGVPNVHTDVVTMDPTVVEEYVVGQACFGRGGDGRELWQLPTWYA